mgnify:CR=1 FL=1
MITAEQVTSSVNRICKYSRPYQDLMLRREQSGHLQVMLLGLSSDLERKSVEPIAVRYDIPRRALQGFVGISEWDHLPLRDLELREVDKEIGSAEGHLILDGSGVPKKGAATVGVKRQYCGRLGKIDNCVIGVHSVYVGTDEQAVLVDSDLYLPQDWLADSGNRARTHVPLDVIYRTQPEIALAQVRRLDKKLRFKWVHGDDEFGRYQELRDEVRALDHCYVFDVPCNTNVTIRLSQSATLSPATSVEQLADALPPIKWKLLTARYGEKGPIRLQAWSTMVRTPRPDGVPCLERMLVVQNVDGTERRYFLCHAPPNIQLKDLVRIALIRHRIEEVFEEAKGEVGMDHFEVRSWHGWHHHMTLTQISHWFFVREQRILGKANNPGITVSMIRTMVGKLLAPTPTPQILADLVNYMMNRNEESRQAAYAAKGLTAPPRRWEQP